MTRDRSRFNWLIQVVLALAYVGAAVYFNGAIAGNSHGAIAELYSLHRMACLTLLLLLPGVAWEGPFGWSPSRRRGLLHAIESGILTMIVFALYVMSLAKGHNALLSSVVDYAVVPVLLGVMAWLNTRPGDDAEESGPTVLMLAVAGVGAAITCMDLFKTSVGQPAAPLTPAAMLALLSGILSVPMLSRAKAAMASGLPPFTTMAVRLFPMCLLGLGIWALPHDRLEFRPLFGDVVSFAVPLVVICYGLSRGTLGFAAVAFNLVPVGLLIRALAPGGGHEHVGLGAVGGVVLVAGGLAGRQLLIEIPRAPATRGARPGSQL